MNKKGGINVKTMKKVLAVILSFGMILSASSIGVFAYSDVNETTTAGEAVGILSNLGILQGFEDGTFRPGETVTRAQMAAVICRMLDYEETAQGNGGNTVFSDVSASHWASGYINVAQQIGVINGYGDGTFLPENEVTYEQAVKMIVCALGYELAAKSKGGYPTGYLSIASSEGINKNAGGKVGSPASRQTIAILVYNSLEVRLFDQQTWTLNGSDEYSKSDDTVLSKYLGVKKWEGVVTEVPFTEYASSGYDDSDTPYITIDGFYREYNNGSYQKYENESKRADASLVGAGGLLGRKVIAYIGDEEDDRTGNYMVYAISEKSNSNTVTSITSTQLVESDDSEWNKNGKISYRKTGGTKVYDIDLGTGVKFYVNYERETSLGRYCSTEDIASYLSEGGKIEVISNDNDDKADVVIISAYSDESVIKEAEEEDDIYTFTLYNNGALEDIDTEADDELVIIYKNGKIAYPEDLEEGDTVSTVEVGKDVRILYVSSDSVTGKVSAYDTYDNTVTIAGKEYELSPFMNGSVKKLGGEEGIFYLNCDGQISYNDSDSASSGNYGLFLAIGYYGGISQTHTVQIAMANGHVGEYDLSSKVKFYDENGDIILSGDEDVAAKLAYMASGSTSAGKTSYTTVANASNMIFRYTMQGSVITKVKMLQGNSYKNYMTSNAKRYDSYSMSYGSVDFDDSTVVFSIDCSYSETNTSRITKSDVEIGKVTDFFSDGEDGYTFAALDEDDGVYGVVLGFDLSTSVPESGNAVIISSVKTVSYDDSDAAQITGVAGGRTVTYIIYDEDGDYAWGDDPADLAKGDIVLVATPDNSNVVKDFKLLYKASRYGMGTVSPNALSGNVSDDVYNAAGKLDKSKTTSSKFYINTDVRNSGGVFAEAEDGITIKNAANYTLVDYSQSTKNPTVERKSSTGVFSTSSKYDSYVFVRVYDDLLAEVVVYRFNSDAASSAVVETPEITVNESGLAVISCKTSGASVYYTADGATPTSASTEYTVPVQLESGSTLKAIGIKSGYIRSEVASKTYTAQTASPVILISDGNVTITCATPGAAIYYTTDATAPTTSSTLYTDSFTVSSGTNVQAFAVKDNYTASAVASKIYSAVLAAPKISIASGLVVISGEKESDIHYTTDGSTPTNESEVYTESFEVSGKSVVKAIAVKEGYENSSVAEKSYVPTLSKPSIKITSGKVEITAENGADIYYTVNGGNPTAESSKYTAEFTLSGAAVVKAIAVKEGYENSSVAEKSYVPVLAKPSIKITGNTVEITAESGADIYYTFDGSTPTTSGKKYTASFTLSIASTVKAIAVKKGCENSDIEVAMYTPPVVAAENK